jgi:hypothetical protein
MKCINKNGQTLKHTRGRKEKKMTNCDYDNRVLKKFLHIFKKIFNQKNKKNVFCYFNYFLFSFFIFCRYLWKTMNM